MKIARWQSPESPEVRNGFVRDDRVVEFPGGLTVADVLAQGLAAAHELDASIDDDGRPLSEVDLIAPVEPASIRDFVAFEEHVEGMTASADGHPNVPAEWYETPTFYFTNPHTVISSGQTLRPPVSQRLDAELELAAVIGGVDGSEGRTLSPEEAQDHIFGYLIMNDWSARDLQNREMKVKLGPCKGKDFAMTLGPWIVTADELVSAHDDEGFLELAARLYVNDTLVGEDFVSSMSWPFNELVAYASRNSRVRPGDVLGSGTVGNGGCLAELWGRTGTMEPAPLVEGDVVRMEIERIGSISNTVGAAQTAPEIPAARIRPRRRPSAVAN